MNKSIDYKKLQSIFLSDYNMCKSDPETIIMQRAAKTQIKAPLFISWEITSECNLSCRHCRAAFNCSRSKHTYPSIDQYKQVIRNFGDNEVHRVGITGGEPLLHPSFFDILYACKKENLDIILYTNATLIGSKEAELLSSILSEDDIVHVSLDGGNKEANDSQRGHGVFDKVINSLEELSTHSINIRLNIVPTVLNEDSIIDLCNIALKYNVKEFGASPLMTSGRAKLENLTPNYSKLFQIEMQVADRLKETAVKYVGGISGAVHNILNVPDFIKSERPIIKRESSEYKICDAGNRKIFIDANGDSYPCSLFAANPEFCGGNIFNSTLEEIWATNTWRIFRNGVTINSNQCKKCPAFSLCNGGCMALAYQTTGNLGDMDPRCPSCYMI